jgi:hypothetical protein
MREREEEREQEIYIEIIKANLFIILNKIIIINIK